jgi:predicted membrane GTPase involved in stress response
MPQTRFVLKNALENHIKPIVVINKVDRPNADPKKAVDEVLDLFIQLGAPDEFLDFPVVYTSALNGTSSTSPDPATQKMAWKRSMKPSSRTFRNLKPIRPLLSSGNRLCSTITISSAVSASEP